MLNVSHLQTYIITHNVAIQNTITYLPCPIYKINHNKPKIIFNLVFRFVSHLLTPGELHVVLHHEVGEHLLHPAEVVTELRVLAALVTIQLTGVLQ